MFNRIVHVTTCTQRNSSKVVFTLLPPEISHCMPLSCIPWYYIICQQSEKSTVLTQRIEFGEKRGWSEVQQRRNDHDEKYRHRGVQVPNPFVQRVRPGRCRRGVHELRTARTYNCKRNHTRYIIFIHQQRWLGSIRKIDFRVKVLVFRKCCG